MKAVKYLTRIKSCWFLSLGLACLSSFGLQAQNLPVKLWDRTFGGSSNDDFRDLGITSDGGYIIGGNSYSGLNGDKTQLSKGDSDYWILKIDSVGNKLWDKSFGGTGREILWSLQETADRGFILAGTSDSGKSWDKSQQSKGGTDFWLVKLDAVGNIIWDKTIGGSGLEDYPSVHQTADGGYIIGGKSSSGVSNDKTEPSKGLSDYWVIRLDPLGNKLWDKTLGGSGLEELHKVKQTADGGFILGGSSESNISGDKSQNSKGFHDYWIVKLDAAGNKLWDVTLGGDGTDILYTIQQTSDGGYIAGGQGSSTKSGDRTETSRGISDYWVVKLNPNGQKIWDKRYGGTNIDDMFTVQECLDGGFVFGGRSMSGVSEDKSQPNHSQGYEDFWIIRVDPSGNKLWDVIIGANNTDTPLTSVLTPDGGILLGGITLSPISGDKTEPARGGIDYWVVKLKGGLGDNPEVPVLTRNYTLKQNQPNPFSKNTSISFSLAQSEEVELTIYNSLGQTVAKHQKKYDAGKHQVQWNELVANKNLKAGTYFYQLSAGEFQDTKRMILLD